MEDVYMTGLEHRPHDPGIMTKNQQINEGMNPVDIAARTSFEDKLRLTDLYIMRLNTYRREKYWTENNIPYSEDKTASPVHIDGSNNRVKILQGKIDLLSQRVIENTHSLRLQYDSLYTDYYDARLVEYLINTELRFLQLLKTGELSIGNKINLKLAVINSMEDTGWDVCKDLVEVSRTDLKQKRILSVNYASVYHIHWEFNGILDHNTHRQVPVIGLTPAAKLEDLPIFNWDITETTPLMKLCLMENLFMNYCTAGYELDNSKVILKMIIPRNIIVYNWWSRRVFTIRMVTYVIDRGKSYFYKHKAAMYVEPGFKLDTGKC